MKIIGSERIIFFEKLLDAENDFIKSFSQKKYLSMFDSGRSAIYYLFKNILKKNTILFPDFYCNEIINPIKTSNWNIQFYKIRKDLIADIDNIIISKKTQYIFIIDYFGFRDQALCEFAKENNLIIIIDRTHSLFSNFNKGDYEVGSFRKLFPVPDGGFLLSNKNIKLKVNNSIWINKKLYSKILRNIYEYYNENETIEKYYVNYSEDSEKLINISNISISQISKFIIEHYNIKYAKRIRRQNFNFIKNNIPCSINPIFDSLDKNTVPQCFPIFIKNRTKIKTSLQKKKIFIPILWRGQHRVAKNILNLHTDEEYRYTDIKRVIMEIGNLINANH